MATNASYTTPGDAISVHGAYPVPGLSLAERLSGRFNAEGDWVGKIFKPLPKEQVSLLRDYVA